MNSTLEQRMIKLLPDASGLIERARSLWHGLGLARQFLVASALAIIVAMGLVGDWLSSRSSRASASLRPWTPRSTSRALSASASSTSPNSEASIPPCRTSWRCWSCSTPARPPHHQLQGLAQGRPHHLCEPARARRQDLPGDAQLSRRPGAGDRLRVGFAHPMPRTRWSGTMAIPMLEILCSGRRRFGGDIIAVVEFYEDATRSRGYRPRQAGGLAAAGRHRRAGRGGAVRHGRRASRTIEQQRRR